MIQKQALSYSRPEFEFFLFPVPKYFIRLTGFHGGQNTNQSVIKGLFGCGFAAL
jgi:hypothetical protein